MTVSTKVLNMMKTRLRLLKMRKKLNLPTEYIGMVCAYIGDNNPQSISFDTDTLRIIIDTGASSAFTFCKQDFITFTPYNEKVNGLGTLEIEGIGTVRYVVKDDQGKLVTIEIKDCYYVPNMNFRLISPQQLCAQSTKKCMHTMNDKVFHLRWNGHTKTVPFASTNNLPIMTTAPGTSLVSALTSHLRNPSKEIVCFKAAKKVPDHTERLEQLQSHDEATEPTTHTLTCSKHECEECDYIKETSKEVLQNRNTTLVPAETKYLRWHQKLGHPSFATMKCLSKKGFIPKFIKDMQEEPMCLGCKLGKATKIKAGSGDLAPDRIINPGDLIHADQAECSQPGRPMTYSGHNSSNKIVCFTVFVDSISKKIWVEFQTSTEAEQTLKGKKRIEKDAAKYNVKIKSFRTDNGVFRSKEFKDNLEKCEQEISFCGVGMHSQNGVAERHIRTIVEKARAMLLHASSHWQDELDTELWTFAVNYAIHIWNNTPREDLDNLTPEERFSGVTLSKETKQKKIRKFHPFGCPTYVLTDKLQGTSKPPRWEPRTRTGIFLGHSSEHASSVSLILNPNTDRISAQYHCVFDDYFHTIQCDTDTKKNVIWDARFKKTATEMTLSEGADIKIEFPDFEKALSLQSDDFTSNFSHGKDENTKTTKPNAKTKAPIKSALRKSKRGVTFQREPTDVPSDKPSQTSSEDKDKSESEEDEDASNRDLSARSNTTRNLQPIRSKKRTYNSRRYLVDSTKVRPGSGSRKSKRPRKSNSKYAALSEIHRLADQLRKEEKTNGKPFSFTEKIDRMMELTALDNGEINDPSPHLLAASINPNILSHSEAMKAHDRDEFEKAMEEEIQRMIENEIFEEIPRELMDKTKSVLRAVWSHRRKTTPAGEIYRHRSRLCVDGSQQKEGIDYTETYSPVVSWTTIRILLILSVLLNLSTKAVDYVQAFPQAELSEEDAVYMRIPPGYKTVNKNTVLKLKKNLYGLKQASYNWHNLLKSGLTKLGFVPSEHEPCLFLKEGIICVVYVDDTLFFAKDDAIIDKHISELRKLDFDLTEEGDVTAFLGVEISKDDNGIITMTQTGLIDNILTLLDLNKDDKVKQHKTPAVSPPLHSDKDGKPRNMKWSYRSAIGMLLYLSRNTRPDIEYAVHTCARFQLDPKQSHENAVKRIGRYLLGTRTKGIIFKPDINKLGELECFVDADFAGNYTKEHSDDPNSVKSRTGCVILYAGCPIMWFSKLQTEISLSTTEAEYIALSTACRELLPMREMFNELRKYLEILPLIPRVRCTLFEDNVGAETLAQAPKMTSRTKHIAIKYHHFREAVRNKILKIKRVDTKDQLADVFTKPTDLHTFEHLRKNIMGWLAIFHLKNSKDEEGTNIFCNVCMKDRI